MKRKKTPTKNTLLKKAQAGFTSPDEYPTINMNSNFGLRFFGYSSKSI